MEKGKSAKLYKRLVISVVSLTCIATGIATAAFSFSWFSNRNDVTRDVKGYTAGAYFGGGDGSSSTPYIISKPIHLYNLAWLYYIGYFKGEEPYFSITSDLSMSGWTLPPIGTSTNPFNGHLEGNSKKISDLTISNDFSILKDKKPSSVTEEDWDGSNTKYGPTPNILGLFGYIAQESDDKGTPSVSNVLISGETVNSVTDTALVGIAAGYVDGKLEKIYIDDSSVNVANETTPLNTTIGTDKISNVSEYTSVGYCTEAYRTEYTRYETTLYEPTYVGSTTYSPSGGGTSGDDYGGSIDVYGFYNRMSSVLSSTSNPLTVSSDYAIPLKFSSSGTASQGSGTPAAVSSSGTTISVSSYSKTLDVDSSVTNIGYYSGAISVQKNAFSNTSFSTSNITSAGNTAISWYSSWYDGKDGYLSSTEAQKIVDALNSDSGGGLLGNHAIFLNQGSYFYGQNAQSSSSSKDFPTSNDAYCAIKDGVIGKEGSNLYYKGDIFIPKNGIWVAPRKAGRFQFIATSNGSYGGYVLLVRLKRKTSSSSNEKYKTGFENSGKYIIATKNEWTYNITGFVARKNSFYYYGIDISEQDIEEGYEYFITSDCDADGTIFNGYPYIIYLDIGDSGGDGSTSETVTRTKVFELLEQITQAFTYPTGVYVTDFDEAVLDTKTLCITLGSSYSGKAKIDIASDAANLIVTASSENNTGVGYYDPSFTTLTNNGSAISDSDFISTDKTIAKTKRVTYYDFNQSDNTLRMFRFSQTSNDGGTTYGDTETETQYKATYASSTLGTLNETTGQTVYNDDGSSSTDGIPSSFSSDIATTASTSKVFNLKLNKSKEDTFTNTYLPSISLDSTNYKTTVNGYVFTIKNGDTAISSDDYTISDRNSNYSLTINEKSI